MKRFAILVLSFFLGSTAALGSINYDGPDETEKTRIEIIRDNGHQTTIRPRSLQPEPAVSITAELFADLMMSDVETSNQIFF